MSGSRRWYDARPQTSGRRPRGKRKGAAAQPAGGDGAEAPRPEWLAEEQPQKEEWTRSALDLNTGMPDWLAGSAASAASGLSGRIIATPGPTARPEWLADYQPVKRDWSPARDRFEAELVRLARKAEDKRQRRRAWLGRLAAADEAAEASPVDSSQATEMADPETPYLRRAADFTSAAVSAAGEMWKRRASERAQVAEARVHLQAQRQADLARAQAAAPPAPPPPAYLAPAPPASAPAAPAPPKPPPAAAAPPFDVVPPAPGAQVAPPPRRPSRPRVDWSVRPPVPPSEPPTQVLKRPAPPPAAPPPSASVAVPPAPPPAAPGPPAPAAAPPPAPTPAAAPQAPPPVAAPPQAPPPPVTEAAPGPAPAEPTTPSEAGTSGVRPWPVRPPAAVRRPAREPAPAPPAEPSLQAAPAAQPEIAAPAAPPSAPELRTPLPPVEVDLSLEELRGKPKRRGLLSAPFSALGSMREEIKEVQSKREREREEERRSILETIRGLPDEGYMQMVLDIFRRDGYLILKAEDNVAGIVDLECQRQGERVFIQFRHRGALLQSEERVREVHQAVLTGGADGGFIFSEGRFTWGADELARQTGIVLVDGDVLVDLMEEITVAEAETKRGGLGKALRGFIGGRGEEQ